MITIVNSTSLVEATEDMAASITGLSVSDDAAVSPAGIYEVVLAATDGTLSMAVLSGLTFTDGDGNSDAGMTFHGTLADINAALASLAYCADADYNGSAQVTFSATDSFGGIVAGGGAIASSDSKDIQVSVSAVNDAVTGSAPANMTLDEDSSAAVTGLSIADADAALAPGGVYEVVLAATHGTLSMPTLSGLTFTEGDGSSDAGMTFHGTLADINNALASASYASDADYHGSAQVTLDVTDSFDGSVAAGSGSATSDSDSVAVTVTAVNDAVGTSAPATASGAEDVAIAVTGVSIADADAALDPSGIYEISLSATHGVLTMSALTGVTFTAGDGSADASMTFNGELSSLNAALATLSFTGDANYNGSAQIAFQATDSFGGTVASGTGSATSDSDTIALTLTAVNDAVGASAPTSVAVNEDLSVAVTGLSISDLDAALASGGVYEVTLAASHGKVSMGTLTGLTFSTGDGTADAGSKFEGTFANVNAALATLSYTGDLNFHGTDAIAFSVTDDVASVLATGSGTATSDSGSVAVTVNSVNDLPGGAVSISGTARVGETLTASNTLTDVDGLGTIGYQWSAGGTIIGAATGASYVVTAADTGKLISVTASYTDSGSAHESVSATMAAPAGAVVIAATAGSSTLTGTAGDDMIVGGRTHQTMMGGAGNDTYVVSNHSVVVEAAGGGTDTVESSSSFVLGAQVENLVLTGLRNANGTGNALDNVLTGNVVGNKLTGGFGADHLTGGAGGDTFVYVSAGDSTTVAWDVITDFSAAQHDRIDLRAIDADVTRDGNQKFVFIGSAEFSDFASAAGLVRFDATTHMLQASVDADADAEFQVELQGVSTLVAANIVL